MARRKNVEVDTVETMTAQVEDTDVVAPVVEAHEEAIETKVHEILTKEKESPGDKIADVPTVVPDNVKDILQTFDRYAELLITKDGGVFLPGTKLSQVKGAILYKNPFYHISKH